MGYRSSLTKYTRTSRSNETMKSAEVQTLGINNVDLYMYMNMHNTVDVLVNWYLYKVV